MSGNPVGLAIREGGGRGRRAAWLLAACVAITATVLLLVAGRASAANAAVSAAGSGAAARFNPNTVTVASGDTVNFDWVSGTHTATAVNGAFDFQVTSGSPTNTWTAGAPGTYYFYCAVHATAAEATEAHVQANDAMVGKVVVTAAASGTPTPTPTATAAPSATATPAATPAGSATPVAAADFTQFGFPTVGGSIQLAAGQGGTVSAGNQTVTIDPGTFATPVTFDLLTGDVATFQPLADPDDTVIGAFAFRVTGPSGLIRTFAKPVHYAITSAQVAAGGSIYNTTATNPPQASENAKPPVVAGQTLTHDFTGAAVGWFTTAPAPGSVAPAPATTGNAGLLGAAQPVAFAWLLGALALATVVGGRLLLRRRR